MNKKQKTKMIVLLLISVAVLLIVALVSYALRQNISLYFTPMQIFKHEAPLNRPIRIGGMVVKGSINQSKNHLDVRFVLTDYQHQIKVRYQGVLPDLFREGQGVVVKGFLSAQNQFEAQEVLAKHDENYMPKEVRDSIKKVVKHA